MPTDQSLVSAKVEAVSHDTTTRSKRGHAIIGPKPLAFNDVPIRRDRVLLILRRENQAALDTLLYLLYLQDLKGFAHLIQRLSDPAHINVPRVKTEGVSERLRGDGGERHNLPILLLHYMADQIILMQALHDDHDGTRLLVIEPGGERVVVEFGDMAY
ncbi:MAG TPA: hypothetical protein VIQ29_02790 [Ancylobacter sp.]